jgi:DNA-binding beta-propeller fold protein YncE
MRMTSLLLAAVLALPATALAQATPAAPAAAGPYKVLNKYPVGGTGGMDYVTADAADRQLLIPRGNRVEVFDLDTIKSIGTITPANGVHGAIVDPQAGHGFCSSNPVVMWDSKTNKTIKTIPVQGQPDGILFDPFTQHVHILSHTAPNVTVIDTKDGSVLGTIDLGGPPEQGASDGNGKLFISIEQSPGKVVVVDAKAMKKIATYECKDKEGATVAGNLAGLVYDPKNKLIFACGRTPANCMVMNAEDGSFVAKVPIGQGVDSAAINPDTQEVFVSTGQDAKLTIIKEKDAKTFEVEQTVTTLQGGKTCALDTKTGHVFVIANDPSAQPAGTATSAPAAPAAPGGRGRGRGAGGVFTVVEVGK